jgi:hypothetical protein
MSEKDGPMALSTGVTIFDYCERGANPAFWAEPLNAITNGGFILAALGGILIMARNSLAIRSAWNWFFVANFVAIGFGSFLFHTIPNVETVRADTIPIGIFMLTYLTFAMRRFFGLSWFLTFAALAGFIGLLTAAMNVQCFDGRFGFLDNVPPGTRTKCLNGSLGYVPALLAMWLTGSVLASRRHPAAAPVLAAAAVFIVSLVFRSVDLELCDGTAFGGHRFGTHFLWHLLNSLTLFLLLAAAIKYGGAAQIMPPRPKPRPVHYATS